MSAAKHTPTPWDVRLSADLEHRLIYAPEAREGVALAFTEAEATFIVRAVNAHDVLVEALTALRAHHDRNHSPIDCDLCRQSDAALAKARGDK